MSLTPNRNVPSNAMSYDSVTSYRLSRGFTLSMVTSHRRHTTLRSSDCAPAGATTVTASAIKSPIPKYRLRIVLLLKARNAPPPMGIIPHFYTCRRPLSFRLGRLRFILPHHLAPAIRHLADFGPFHDLRIL